MKEYELPFRDTMKGFREFFDAGLLAGQRIKDFPYPYGSLIKAYMQWNKNENYLNGGSTVPGYVGCGKRIADPALDSPLFDDINSDHSFRHIHHHENEYIL